MNWSTNEEDKKECPTSFRSTAHQSNETHVMEQVFQVILLLMADPSVSDKHSSNLLVKASNCKSTVSEAWCLSEDKER